MEQLLSEGTQFYTEGNVNINSRIKSGKTMVSTCRVESEALARQKRSYVYEVFAQDKKEPRPIFYGFAVPK